ncbi:MAG: copper-translocating P-type ATPase [Planctomycetaceae bacterium]|nr:copper-translocating P-type ATPase [Planctomycetaceae bacterium]
MTTLANPPNPKTDHVLLDVQGMHCAGCASLIEAAVSKVEGVTWVRVNLVGGRASIQFDPDRTTAEQLAQKVIQGGYRVEVIRPDEDLGAREIEKESRERAGWRRRLVVGTALLAVEVILAFSGLLSGLPLISAQFVLATVLQIYVGWPYFVGALLRARNLTANMDTLIALGTGAAYVSGVVHFAQSLTAGIVSDHATMAFMDAGMILTFITLGKYLEVRAKGRASRAIRRLLDLSPQEAVAIRNDQPVTVAVEAVMVDETILVRPGARVPLDAEVLTGTSNVDQSWLTGESIPVEKQAGDEILAGTINGEGALTARVLRPAGQSALARVIELVRHAQESKTDVGRLADRVVGWFVPGVLLIAAVTLLAWGLLGGDWSTGFTCTVAVLVVACPCALGLATPTAILVGSGRGAEQGILVKEAHALETAAKVTTAVLDKTGTVTEGRPRVTEIVPLPEVNEATLLAAAAAAERLSDHPLARAVVEEAERRGIDIPKAEALQMIAGQGIQASMDNRTVRVGNARLLGSASVSMDGLEQPIRLIHKRGQSALAVAINDRPLGVIAVGDRIAEGSVEGVATLRKLGIDVQLLSGDHRTTAEAVAHAVGIEHVTAEVLPDEKHAVVERLRAKQQTVAMVGDGINDAPALVAADLGIAMGTGADVAIESADVVLVKQDLRAVAATIRLGRATLRTIRQNLAWAFVYNLLLIPLAAGALILPFGLHLPPAAAAAAMAMSSVSVVTNSLLLRRRV